jgi:PilZ domain
MKYGQLLIASLSGIFFAETFESEPCLTSNTHEDCQEMSKITNPYSLERRNHQRHFYSGHVFFATKNRLHEGRLLNYSQSGLLIKSEQMLAAGELITVAVPYTDNEQAKRQAIVIWCNRRGMGAKFVTVH